MRKLNFLIVMLALMAGCSSLSTDVTERVAVGDALPAFTIQLADGTTLHSRELSGKPENDVWFCEADRQVPFELEEGGFTVFLPGEAHAPGLYPEKDRRPLSPAAPVSVWKLVVKVLMD